MPPKTKYWVVCRCYHRGKSQIGYVAPVTASALVEVEVSEEGICPDIVCIDGHVDGRDLDSEAIFFPVQDATWAPHSIAGDDKAEVFLRDAPIQLVRMHRTDLADLTAATLPVDAFELRLEFSPPNFKQPAALTK